MIQLFKSFAAKLWLSLLLLVILGGLLISAGRILTPFLSEFKTELADLASQTLGQPIEVGALSARWRGWGPAIVLREVSLREPGTGKTTLEVAQIDIAVNLLDSLRTGAIVPRHIVLTGVRLAVRLEEDGRLNIRGLGHLGEDGGDTSGLFLAPRSVSIRESEVLWENRAVAGPPVVFSRVNVSVVNDGDRHQLKGELQLADYAQARLALALDISTGRSASGWTAEAYLKGETFPLARLLANRLPPQYALLNGLGEFELWGSLQSTQSVSLSGTVQGRDIIVERQVASETPIDTLMQIDRLKGTVQFSATRTGWSFRGRDMQLDREGNSWPLGRFELIAAESAGGQRAIRVAGDFLPLSQMDSLARFLLPPGDELRQALYAVAPEGDLFDLKAGFRQEQDASWTWSVEGEAARVTSRPWRRFPGVDNLTFRFSADMAGGKVEFDTSKGALEFPELFRAPLALDELHGRVDWRRSEDGGWSISSREISATNQDIATRSRLSLVVPGTPSESPFLDLQTDFLDGDASTTSRYLPVGIMPAGVVEWLDRSIVAGRVVSGSCLVRGPVRDFPFSRTPTGRFEVLFQTEDMTLDYWPGWPAGNHLDAEVRFLNDSFDAWVSAGSILESAMGPTHTRIDELSHASPLKLEGTITAPFNEALRLLFESPLGDSFGSVARELDGEGDVFVELGFALPLRGEDRLDLQGRVSFLDARMNLAGGRRMLNAIDGTIQFDERRLWSDEISAQLVGRDVRIQLETDAAAEAVRLHATGRFTLDELLGGMNLDGPVAAKGESDWRLELKIPNRLGQPGRTLQARILSDLRGIEVDLPAPFGKTASETRPVEIVADLAGGDGIPVTARFGSLLSAYLMFESGRGLSLRGANIVLGGRAARRPETADLNIRGELALLDLTGFLRPDAGENPLPPLKQLSVRVDRLRLNEFEIDNAGIEIDRVNTAWIGVYTSDQADGSIRIPFDRERERLQLRLARLNLEGLETRSEESPPAHPLLGSTLDPETMPLIDLTIDRLSVNGFPLGSFSAATARHPGGVELKSLTLQGDELDLSLYGTWRKRADATQETLTGFRVKSGGLGPLLSSLGLYDDLDGAAGEFEGELTWLGSPLDFDHTRIDGNIALQLDKGRLIELNPGLGRVLGLVNVSTITRRLTLDFTDLVKKGFAFDSVEGSFRFEGGDAFTNNLVVKAPSSQIELSGRSGLATEDMDYLVTVTPRISSTIPVAGTIVGGPIVGAALLVAQQLLGNQVDAVSRFQYLVQGARSEPQITLQEVEPEDDSDPFERLGGD